MLLSEGGLTEGNIRHIIILVIVAENKFLYTYILTVQFFPSCFPVYYGPRKCFKKYKLQ